MGTYGLSADEIVENLNEWLLSLEGDLDSNELAIAFNTIAKKESWEDRLKAEYVCTVCFQPLPTITTPRAPHALECSCQQEVEP